MYSFIFSGAHQVGTISLLCFWISPNAQMTLRHCCSAPWGHNPIFKYPHCLLCQNNIYYILIPSMWSAVCQEHQDVALHPASTAFLAILTHNPLWDVSYTRHANTRQVIWLNRRWGGRASRLNARNSLYSVRAAVVRAKSKQEKVFDAILNAPFVTFLSVIWDVHVQT